MVQALAFAEIFLGLILLEAGYKSASISQVVKGEAGEGVAPAPLGSTITPKSASGSELPPAAPATFPFSSERARLEMIQKNRSFGPSPENSPSALTAPIGSKP